MRRIAALGPGSTDLSLGRANSFTVDCLFLVSQNVIQLMFVTQYPPFRPHLLLGNPHLQTIASFFQSVDLSKSKTQRYVVRTDDDDVLVIHDNIPKKWITGDRIVILLHGLCGSHQSTHVVRTAEKLRRSGYRTIRMDMRGQGDSQYLSRGHGHGAASDDLAAVIRAVHSLSPLSYITLIGFSLGGNMVLKLCGRWGQQPPSYVDSAIAVSPPIDLIMCSGNLRQWGNRMYDYFFCSQLKKSLDRRRARVPGLYDNGLKNLPHRLVHLDDQFIAPVHGFDGARDYYAKASSAAQLRDISLSTLIVAAQDDPIVPYSMFQQWVMSTDVELITIKHGGHLGFVSSTPGDPDRHWLEWRLVRWISDFDSHQIEIRAREARGEIIARF